MCEYNPETPLYQRTVQKPESLNVWGYIRAYAVGNLHVWKDTSNAEEYKTVLEQDMLLSRQCLSQGKTCIFQQDTYCLQHNRVASQETPGAELIYVRSKPFTSRKHLVHHKIRQRPRTVELDNSLF